MKNVITGLLLLIAASACKKDSTYVDYQATYISDTLITWGDATYYVSGYSTTNKDTIRELTKYTGSSPGKSGFMYSIPNVSTFHAPAIFVDFEGQDTAYIGVADSIQIKTKVTRTTDQDWVFTRLDYTPPYIIDVYALDSLTLLDPLYSFALRTMKQLQFSKVAFEVIDGEVYLPVVKLYYSYADGSGSSGYYIDEAWKLPQKNIASLLKPGVKLVLQPGRVRMKKV